MSASWRNCGTALVGGFCHDCGQRVTGPIRYAAIQRELARETIELNGRYVRTIIELSQDPGAAIRGYLDGRRVRLFNPGKYLLVNAALFLVVAPVVLVLFFVGGFSGGAVGAG